MGTDRQNRTSSADHPGQPREIAAQAEAQTRKKLSQSQPYRPNVAPANSRSTRTSPPGCSCRQTAAENKQAYAGVTKQKIDYSWTEAVVQSFDKVAHNPRAALGRGQAYEGGTARHTGRPRMPARTWTSKYPNTSRRCGS